MGKAPSHEYHGFSLERADYTNVINPMQMGGVLFATLPQETLQTPDVWFSLNFRVSLLDGSAIGCQEIQKSAGLLTVTPGRLSTWV